MRESFAYGITVLGVIVGLALLLVGEGTHGHESFVPIGGVVVLASVGLLTGLIARL